MRKDWSQCGQVFCLTRPHRSRKAETIEWAWDKEGYEGVSDQGMKLYCSVLLSKKKYPGKEDRHRAPTQTRDAPATTSASPSTQAQDTTAAPASSSTQPQDMNSDGIADDIYVVGRKSALNLHFDH